jgi:branched-chain amino acid transport system ATP-binding protein
MSAPALDLRDVHSGYSEVPVVRGVTLQVAPGQVFAVLGKNGMGKSTLLKTIMGFLPLREGAVHILGQDTSGFAPFRVARKDLAYTAQEQALFPDLSVEENLKLGLRERKRWAERLQAIGELFPFVPNRLRQRAGTLSGGEQKMLLVARALLNRPKLLLVDEISEGLQPSVIERLAQVFARERDTHHTAILLVEQNVRFALSVADRYAVLNLGEVVDSGAAGGAGLEQQIAAQLSV